MSFVFYDVETTGVHRHFDQILQFAAILTDPDLNEIDRFETRCRLLPHVVPSPGALRVTRVDIARILDPALPTHYEMMCGIADRLSDWSPAVFLGWNTIEFDEELLRQAFWQCLHPPYLTNSNGNARTDLLRISQALTVDEPHALVVPVGDNGKPSFKLDRLAPANGFDHSNAHDALSDVEATVHVSRIIRDRAPDYWSEVLRFCSKASALAFMEEEDAFMATECYFGKPYRYALTRIALEPGNPASVLAYDLTIDPASLRDLDDAALVARLGRSPKPVRRIRANKSPLLRELRAVGTFKGLTPAGLEACAAVVRADAALCARLVAAAERAGFEESPHVEERIYDGFPCKADQLRMRSFHQLDWQRRARLVEEFEDARLLELGRRLVYHHAPGFMPADARLIVDRALAARTIGHGHDDAPWLTVGAAYADALSMLEQCDDAERVIVQGLIEHLGAERSRCEGRLGLM